MQVEEIASPHVIGQTPRIDNVNGRKSPRSQLSVVLRFSQIRSTKGSIELDPPLFFSEVLDYAPLLQQPPPPPWCPLGHPRVLSINIHRPLSRIYRRKSFLPNSFTLLRGLLLMNVYGESKGNFVTTLLVRSLKHDRLKEKRSVLLRLEKDGVAN